MHVSALHGNLQEYITSGVQFMLVDITKFARHLCPSVSRFVTERTVHCSITVVKQTVHVLTAVWEGLCVSDVITIT
jgi:hypothetical protein